MPLFHHVTQRFRFLDLPELLVGLSSLASDLLAASYSVKAFTAVDFFRHGSKRALEELLSSLLLVSIWL